MTAVTTRLSLYKLFLHETPWVPISSAEHRGLLTWLASKRSRTQNRNQYDSLYETFVWFPTDRDGTCLVPLGHLTRIDRLAMPNGRVPVRNPPPVVIRERGSRPSVPGTEILQIRLSQMEEGVTNGDL